MTGPSLEVKARTLVADLGPDSGLAVLVEPAISDAGFYVWADSAVYVGWCQGYLSGSPEPSLVTRKRFETDGYEFLLTTKIAIGPADFRAAVRVPSP